MKSKLPSLESLKTTHQALCSGDLTVEDIEDEINQRRSEHFFEISKSIPNPMAEIPEGNKLIVLIDIVGFSKSSTREQVYNIYLFQRYLISRVLSNKVGGFRKKIRIRNFIPTGDGCYIVADECKPEVALDFLVELCGGVHQIVLGDGQNMSLRISALIGSCVPFLDVAKHLNYVGEGMNEAARILSGGQKQLEDYFEKQHPQANPMEKKMFSRNSIYLGDSLAGNLSGYEEDCNQIICFRDVADKHGMKRNVSVLQGIWN